MKLEKRGSRYFFVSENTDELGRTATLWHYQIHDEETGKPHSVGFGEPGFESREAARAWAESLVKATGTYHVENVPCKKCGRNDLPLHVNFQCAECGP